MKTATLALIVRNNKVLLGYKKTGEIGVDTLNGPGGKKEMQDNTLEDCVRRETLEEVGIKLNTQKLEKLGVLTFFVNGNSDFEVHVFYTEDFEGNPIETTDMIPDWYDINNLPLNKMLESDKHWFKRMCNKEKFNANIYYKNRASDFIRVEFL